MGLDVVLGLVIFVAAVRGWLRGFVTQAVRLAGLIGSVYAAAPIRDAARPYVASQFTTIRPELLDRSLWWFSAVAVYVVSVGLVSLAVKMQRRKPFGETEANRTDQFAGFLMGGIKGALVVTFLVSGLQRYVVPRIKGVDWVEEQATNSYALKWEGEYQPARRVWKSVPVQHFVSEIKRMGIPPTSSDPKVPASVTEPDPVQAARADAPPRLELDRRATPPIDPDAPDFARRFDQALEQLAPAEPTSR